MPPDDLKIYEDELKLSDMNLICSKESLFWHDYLNLSNNYVKLNYILSLIFRFIFIVKTKMKLTGQISNEIFNLAKKMLIKIVQVGHFEKEIETLKKVNL